METITELQKLLAGTQIFLMNARAYHWNIKGNLFFMLHEEFGKLYENLSADVDRIAERIRALGGIPMHKYSDYLKLSGIAESETSYNATQIVAWICNDLLKTRKQLYSVMQAAQQEKDEGTINMMGDMIEAIEKTIWFWTSYTENSRTLSTLLTKKS